MDRALLAFGAGSRVCIGRNLVQLELLKIWPVLIKNYKFEPVGEVKLHDVLVRVTKRDAKPEYLDTAGTPPSAAAEGGTTAKSIPYAVLSRWPKSPSPSKPQATMLSSSLPPTRDNAPSTRRHEPTVMGPADVEKQQDAGLQDAGQQEAPREKAQSAFRALGWLDRFLAVWILLAMVVGVLLGNFVPQTGRALQKGEFVGVSVPIAVGLLVMMYPILCKVRYESLHELFAHRGIWKQIGFSIVINWIVAPFIMLALAWAFLPDKPNLRVGLILVTLPSLPPR
ncbi:hypothetical protein VTK73DRAFT_4426 [Phialemonium thermophilum]|uniref:Uncharacterized protein n=1 Tax=Phialemonium thermophilum TaxID=223376 RepID=A0ABR3V8Y5_9PEZI